MLRAIKNAIFSVFGPDWFLTISALWNIHRSYEPHFQEWLKTIPQGGTLLDVGANIGITCAIAKRRRPDINMIAFEPVPHNVKVLHRVKSIYSIKNMQIQSIAIGDKEGQVSMTIPMIDGLIKTGLSHVVSEEFSNPTVKNLPSFKTVDVGIRALDSFSFERVDAIKIDVEGHEYQVLNGARQLLLLFRPLVFCEMWSSSNRAQTIELMDSLGYSVTSKGAEDFLFTPQSMAEPSRASISE